MNVIILPIPYSDVRLHFKQGCIWRWHESRHEDMKLEETQRTFTHFDTEGFGHLGSNMWTSEHFTTTQDCYEDCIISNAKDVEW